MEEKQTAREKTSLFKFVVKIQRIQIKIFSNFASKKIWRKKKKIHFIEKIAGGENKIEI